jgi:hypothetical protein
MEKNKLYVLIDETLSDVYGCVQGGHAVAQYLLDHPNQTWNNNYLIYVKCKLSEWIVKLQGRDKDFSIFYEPDLNNVATAIAVEDSGKLFRKLKLVG